MGNSLWTLAYRLKDKSVKISMLQYFVNRYTIYKDENCDIKNIKYGGGEVNLPTFKCNLLTA